MKKTTRRTTKKPASHVPPIVSPAKWRTAHDKMIAKEKAATRARDRLAAERRRLPIPHLSHLHVRDTSLVLVSRAPLANIKQYQERMGWTVPWFSSSGSDFNRDFGLTTKDGETFGLSVFLRDGENVYRTHFVDGRGVEHLGSPWTFLDLTPYGRQETWEDSPAGWPQTPPYQWWRRHDDYDR